MNAHQRLEARRARRKARVAARTDEQGASRLEYQARVLVRGVSAWDRMVKIASNPLPDKEAVARERA